MRTAAILPVKRFERAKQRLGVTVADPLRLDLARAMVGDVLTALRDCPSLDLRIVVTSEESVAAAARYQGAIVVKDDAQEGQSAAATLGLERALAEGAQRALCIPGDCPALDPAELAALLLTHAPPTDATLLTHAPPTDATLLTHAPPTDATLPADAGAPREIVIVPDRHGTGTNGLLLRPPDAITPSFGPGSCERHQALAREAGVPFRLERPASLLLDIDTGEDLQALRERLAGETVRAPRTRTVLGLGGAQRQALSAS